MAEEIKKPMPVKEQIANRNSWLKVFVVSAATIVIGLKIWQADFDQVFSGFDFSDLLALLLALFSIALAILFYMKATDTANVFYNNTYAFTRDVSEILGRVEAGFGEKLTHLDEGLRSAVDRIPYDSKQAEKDLKEEAKEVEKFQKERDELIDDLAKRAKLHDKEREELLSRLKENERELSRARGELRTLRRRVVEAESVQRDLPFDLPSGFERYFTDEIVSRMSPTVILKAPTSRLSRELMEVIGEDDMKETLIADMKEYGIIDNDDKLTSRGRQLIRRLLRREVG